MSGKSGALPIVVAAGIGVALLMGLGVWQVQRLQWKERVVAQIEARQHAPITSVPPESDWPTLRSDDYEYRHVAVIGTYLSTDTALVYRGSAANAKDAGPGYLVLTPLRLPSGETVIVNRGFAPTAAADEARANIPSGAVSVTGLMREPEGRNAFTPADDPARGIWYTRDAPGIGAAQKLSRVAPFTIDADSDPKARGWPRPGTTVVDIPNNHLSYALTWFGLAATLAGVTVAFLRSGHGRKPIETAA